MVAWFFSDGSINTDKYIIKGENAAHISRSLRMRAGETLTIVTPDAVQCGCIIDEITRDAVSVSVTEKKPCENEPSVFVTLYQALPKGDKMDYIVQKCVELGVSRIVPVLSARCVSRPDESALPKKLSRWHKISKQAAMQSRRGIIPEIGECVSFDKAAELANGSDKKIIFYEEGGESVKKIIDERPDEISIFIGSEGGFEKSEVELITSLGGYAATLGKRILRAETAPLAALSIIMYQTDNF